MLLDADPHCGFTRELRPIGGYEPRLSNLYQSQLAALIAHGTNLGIAAMGHRPHPQGPRLRQVTYRSTRSGSIGFPTPGFNREEARAAVRRIRERAQQHKLGRFNWSEWKAFRDEGRP